MAKTAGGGEREFKAPVPSLIALSCVAKVATAQAEARRIRCRHGVGRAQFHSVVAISGGLLTLKPGSELKRLAINSLC